MRALLKNKLEKKLLKHREVVVRDIDGDIVEGVVHDLRSNNGVDEVTIMYRGDWNKRLDFNIDEIEVIESSNYPYYSMKHKIELRERHKPMIGFRYCKEEIQELKGKYVSVNYDGKKLEGEVIGVSYVDPNTAGITIKSIINNEIKYIKTYRLRELVVVGSTYNEYLGFKEIQSLDNKLHKITDDCYSKGSSEEPEVSYVSPRDLLEEYFEAMIDKHNKLKVSLAKFDYDWRKDVRENKNSYRVDGDWTSESEEVYNKDLIQAGECNLFYQLRKELIEDIILKVQEVSWKDYGMSQLEGEINALNYICQSEYIYEKISSW